MITLKPLEAKFANADLETKNQLKELALAEALKTAVSDSELTQRLNSLEAKLNARLKALENDQHRHEPSQLEVKPKKAEPKEPSLLSEILKVIKNRKK